MRKKLFEILHVEDNDMDALLVQKSLDKIGLAAKLMRVKDGSEAIDFLFGRGKFINRNTKILPKLILLDLNLPIIHGFQVLENIRRNSGTMDIPVVVMTVSTAEQDELRSQALGVNAYLTKSFDEAKFVEVVREIELYWFFFNKPPIPIFA